MARRPYVVLSAAISADGCLDDASATRLILSGPQDLDQVDELRAGCDAILVGAATIRTDDPALVIRSEDRRLARARTGRPADPVKVTLTRTGDGLHQSKKFFAAGHGAKVVYLPEAAAAAMRGSLGAAATIVGLPASGPAAAGAAGLRPPGRGAPGGAGLDLAAVLADLAARGIARLLVEGGGTVLAQFLAGAHADELRLAVAPFFVGDPAAPRLALPGRYPRRADGRMTLAGAERAGDMAVLRYLL